MNKKLWCSELMQKKNKEFKLGVLNNLNGNAGSGKTDLLLKYMFENPLDFIEAEKGSKYSLLSLRKNRVLYVTDTNNLRSQMLTKHKCKELKKGVLKDYVENDMDIENLISNDQIITCNYATLGYNVQNPKYIKWFIKHFDVIIFDESHNLIKWYYQFDNVENSSYCYIVNNLKCFVDNTLLICASATNEYLTNYLKSYHSEGENAIEVNTIFTEQELSRELRQYKNKKTEYYINMDKAYSDIIKKVKKGQKALIWEAQIKTIKKLEQRFRAEGLEVLSIWSAKNPKHPLSEKQKDSIDYLLEEEKVEDKYDIVIINEATTTGVNIKSKEFEICIVNNTKNEIVVQARNRLRKDIKLLILPYCAEMDGCKIEKCVDVVSDEPKEIPKKYLNKHLSEEEKRLLIDKYCPSYWDKNYNYVKEKSWRKFEEYLYKWGYRVKNDCISNKEDDNDMLEEYLNLNIGRIYTKEEKEELINKINLRDGRNRLQKQPDLLKTYLEGNFNLTLNYDVETTRIVNGKRKKFKHCWKILSFK